MKPDNKKNIPVESEISDNDLYEAMKDIRAYLDITPADLKQVYTLAYRHALQRITSSVKAADIMTKEVFSVTRDTPLREVAEVMAEKKISGVPVLDNDGSIAGIISEKDFLSHIGRPGKKHFMAFIAECLKTPCCGDVPIRSQTAADIMNSPAITISEDTTVSDISNLFAAKNINRAPVTDRTGGLSGIVCRMDILRASTIKPGQKNAAG